MNYVIVDLAISQDEMLRYYQGSARNVLVRARDGRSIRFPANVLRDHVSSNGVQGTFAIYFSADNKLKKIERLA